MKNIFYQLIIFMVCVAFILFVGPTIGAAEVIFSEDFSSWNSDYPFDSYDDPGPDGWSFANGNSAGYATFDGVTHYTGEVTTPGRAGASDRALKIWRHSTFTSNDSFYGLLGYQESNLHTTRELYTRWYMKIPVNFKIAEDASCYMNYQKLWRYLYGASGVIYLNFNGSNFTSAKLQLYALGDTSSPTWKNIINVADIQDGEWHCHELRIKLNTQGNADGEYQYWLDGVEIMHFTGAAFGANENEYFSSTQFGMGNSGIKDCSPQGEFQSTWSAIEFDDYVLSTTYVGPEGTASAPPPDTGGTPPPQATPEPYKLVLSETWENDNTNNWDDDFIAGDTHIDTDPVYEGNYAIKMESSEPGNYVHFFGDHPGIDGDMVTDVTIEEYYYPSPGFQWPEGLKLWIMNCFESWGAGYNLAEGQSKPHTWAPYYMTTWVNNRGELAGQLVRSDGLGGTGALWQNYYQNIGSPVSLTPGTWNKIKIRLKLNTIGSSDGIYELWVNDEKKCYYTNVNYRGTYSIYGWNHLMMSMHAFPSSPQSQWISRDNIEIHSGPPIEPPGFPKVK